MTQLVHGQRTHIVSGHERNQHCKYEPLNEPIEGGRRGGKGEKRGMREGGERRREGEKEGMWKRGERNKMRSRGRTRIGVIVWGGEW